MHKKILSLLLASGITFGYTASDTQSKVTQQEQNIDPNTVKPETENQDIANFKPFISKLVINARGGEFLILENDTVWEIDPNYLVVSSGWLSPVPIAVSLGFGEYPYRLTNQLSRQDVAAKKSSWDAIPESDDLPSLTDGESMQAPSDNTPAPPIQTPLEHRQSLQSRQQQPIPNQNNPVPNPPKTGINQAE